MSGKANRRDVGLLTAGRVTSRLSPFWLVSTVVVFVMATTPALAQSASPEQGDATVEVGTESDSEEAAKLDCEDFATQRAAQETLELAPEEDRFGLDGDGDGEACETPQNLGVEDGTVLGADTGGDRDCLDFPSQMAAQERLRSDPSDPYGLDIDDNGVACDILPAPYDDPAQDLEPVGKARSSADLDCEDFEYQQEAQMVYFQDESDPHDLDRGEGGSEVCPNLPLLWSNVELVYAVQGENSEGPPAGQKTPTLLAQAWIGDTGGLIWGLRGAALLFVLSGILALLAARRTER